MAKIKKNVVELTHGSLNIQQGCENKCEYGVCKLVVRNSTVRKEAKRLGVAYDSGKPTLNSNLGIVWNGPSRSIAPDLPRNKITVGIGTVHDFVPANCEWYLSVLKHMILKQGYRALMQSKMSYAMAKYLYKNLPKEFIPQLMTMITITTLDDNIRQRWEGCAPSIPDRFDALRFLYEHGINTSTSLSPLLKKDYVELVEAVRPYTTGVILLGTMDRFKNKEFKTVYTYDDILEMIIRYEHDPRIYLKSSAVNVLKKVSDVDPVGDIIDVFKKYELTTTKEENILRYNIGVKHFVKYGTQMDSSNIYYIARFHDGNCYGLCLNNHDDNKLAHINGHFRYVNPDNYDPFVAKELPISNNQPVGHYPRFMFNPTTEQVHRVEQTSPNNFNSIIVAPIRDDDIETAKSVDIDTLIDFDSRIVKI